LLRYLRGEEFASNELSRTLISSERAVTVASPPSVNARARARRKHFYVEQVVFGKRDDCGVNTWEKSSAIRQPRKPPLQPTGDATLATFCERRRCFLQFRSGAKRAISRAQHLSYHARELQSANLFLSPVLKGLV